MLNNFSSRNKNTAEAWFELGPSDSRAPVIASMLDLDDQCLPRRVTEGKNQKEKGMDKERKQRNDG